MEPVKKTIKLPATPTGACHAFVEKINNWWPKEYTWSQNALKELKINPVKNGLLTETGPYNFRSDWGRVIEIKPDKIIFLWQISPKREPVPDPDKASEVEIKFKHDQGSGCVMELEHRNFEKHGEGAAAYRNAMGSDYGWDVIIKAFKNYLSNKEEN